VPVCATRIPGRVSCKTTNVALSATNGRPIDRDPRASRGARYRNDLARDGDKRFGRGHRRVKTGDRYHVTSYLPDKDRYASMTYRRCGRSGLLLPAVSLGLWQNFGLDRPLDTQRAILRRAFDLGITHFDLANNYGPPYGSAESNFARILHDDFRLLRDELIISTKAGWDMWPGPYGDQGSRKYLLASLDQSLQRLGLDYVDIFYHHHFDSETPLEETLGALHSAVTSGKALYVGISSYSDERTSEAVDILRGLGTPLLIHQPSYSMLNRWIEDRLLDVLGERGVGCIAFSVLAQGLLTDRYLNGIPEGSRASQGGSLASEMLNDDNLARIRSLNDIAEQRGQSVAQMAIAWALRDPRVTSVLIGASSVAQLEQNVAALDHLDFTVDELANIDRYAVESEIDLWRGPATA
jgi:L-glyceraldehyde 3-phosphate reductase